MNESLDELRAENERLRDALASRDAALQERDAALQERDATLKERDASLSARDAKIVDYELRVLTLAVEVNRLERQLFGQKAERVKNDEAQQSLFDVLKQLGRLPSDDGSALEAAEALIEDASDDIEQQKAEDDEDDNSRHAQKRRKKQKKHTPHGRAKLDESALPLVTVVLEPDAKFMPGGEALQKIGEDVTYHLDHIPSSTVRVAVVRPKYLHPDDVGTAASSAGSVVVPGDANDDDKPAPLVTVHVADAPELPIPRGIAGPGLLSHVLVSKYGDHIPLHRQERIFAREGFRLSRSSLCGFVQGSVDLLQHVTNAMWDDVKAAKLVLTDATGVLIRQKERCGRGHFQVVIEPARHVVFRYLDTIDGAAIAEELRGLRGLMQCDASSVYHELFRQEPHLIEVGCWAHARRNFFEALATDRQRALVGIGFISALYEAHYKATHAITDVVDVEKRRKLASVVLDDLKAWREQETPQLAAGTPIERALGYLGRHWVALTRFLHDGRLRLDNNPSERELRHQVVGRKNWLFCATRSGAVWNTVVVTLIASCRLHDIEPWAYLRDLLTIMPAWDQRRALELAPLHWNKTRETAEVQDLLKRRDLLGRGQRAHAGEDAHEGGSGA